MKVYYDQDASLELLKQKKIAILGYGSQGHAHSLNLKESGMNVTVAEVPGSEAWKAAEDAGLTVKTAEEASAESDVIMILLPDQIQKTVYYKSVVANLKEGDTLVFAHGFNIHYKQIVPPENINVMMVAPKGPGHLVRRTFTEGTGVPCLIAIEQDYTLEYNLQTVVKEKAYADLSKYPMYGHEGEIYLCHWGIYPEYFIPNEQFDYLIFLRKLSRSTYCD